MKKKVERFLALIEDRLKPIDCGGLFSTDGYGILYTPNSPSDFATLPQTTRLLNQYLKIQPGQIVMTSDPSCGSALPTDITLVAGVGVGQVSDFLLTSRIRFRPQIYLEATFPNEILRIPPTPLSGFPYFETQGLLQAISQQFQVPPDFPDRIAAEVDRLQLIGPEISKLFQRLCSGTKPKLFLDSLREFQRKGIQSWFEDLPLASVQHHRELDSSGRLGLEMHGGSSKIRMDFSKSDLSPEYNLTHAMTTGVAAAALWSFFDGPQMICSAFLDFAEIVTPTQSRLNSQHPASTSLGELLLAPLIFNCVSEACNHLMPKKAVAQLGSAILLEVSFAQGLKMFDRILGGGGASHEMPGLDGQSSWLRLPLFPSIEEIEKRFPMRVLRHERRGGSGGRGLMAGGEGTRRTLEFLESAKVTWAFEQSRTRAEGWKGGSSGDSASITISPPGEEPRPLARTGTQEVTPGTRMTLLSAGGGGFERIPT